MPGGVFSPNRTATRKQKPKLGKGISLASLAKQERSFSDVYGRSPGAPRKVVVLTKTGLKEGTLPGVDLRLLENGEKL